MLQWRSVTVSVVLVVFLLSGCGKSEEKTLPIENLLPAIPGNTNFGALYPRINNALSGPNPDIYGAIRDTKVWAEQHLPEFREGSCATVSVLSDPHFAELFGEHTLGVTIPWMQIYIRDGQRQEAPFVWQDASLFVSTILHEYVHAGQRARQAKELLNAASSCDSAHYALSSHQNAWQFGFEQMRAPAGLAGLFSPPERLLLYHWSSPIEQARDEIEAALFTVKWMNDNPEELNAMTVGAVNNWAYGVQHLNLLKLLATTKCFSPDDRMFAAENRIYQIEIPAFARAFQQYEPQMREYLKTHNLPALPLSLSDVVVAPKPDGRLGYKCDSHNLRSTLPGYLLEDGRRIRLKPIPIDAPNP